MVNTSRSGEKLKKGTFLEKKGGYFKLSGENNLTLILSAFHPFVTLPNKTYKAFLRFRNVPIKRAKYAKNARRDNYNIGASEPFLLNSRGH